MFFAMKLTPAGAAVFGGACGKRDSRSGDDVVAAAPGEPAVAHWGSSCSGEPLYAYCVCYQGQSGESQEHGGVLVEGHLAGWRDTESAHRNGQPAQLALLWLRDQGRRKPPP